MKKGFGARLMLAAIGGLAAAISGIQGYYRPDAQTTGRRLRIGSRNQKGERQEHKPAGSKKIHMTGATKTKGGYGRNLKAHFDQTRGRIGAR